MMLVPGWINYEKNAVAVAVRTWLEIEKGLLRIVE